MNSNNLMNWAQTLDVVVEKFPNRIALQSQQGGLTLTYKQLQMEIRAWALHFQSLGVSPGDRIAYLSTNSIEHLVLLYACAEIGAILVPMNFRLAPQEIRETLIRMEPKVLITRGEWQALSSKILQCHHLRVEDASRFLESYRGRSPDRYLGGLLAPVMMLYTSGSSGLPKGVLLHGQMLLQNQEGTVQNWGLLENDITLVESPFFHTGGYNVLCLPILFLGGTVIIAEKFDAERTLTSLENEKVSVYFAVPTMFQMLKEHQRFSATNLSHLRFLVTGGAACPVELIRAYQARSLLFKQGFGLTEVGPNCFLLTAEDSVRKAGSIGKPMPHTKALLLNDRNEICGANEAGELMLGGHHVCAGYFGENERFQKATYTNSAGETFFRTGDVARMDEEGFFFIVGRKKEMFISGGENVYPAEVERAIGSHPEILACAVVSKPHPKWGEVGVAFIRAKKKIELNELKNFLGDKLSRYKHPQEVHLLKDFPLLASGKVDKHQLQTMALTPNLHS